MVVVVIVVDLMVEPSKQDGYGSLPKVPLLALLNVSTTLLYGQLLCQSNFRMDSTGGGYMLVRNSSERDWRSENVLWSWVEEPAGQQVLDRAVESVKTVQAHSLCPSRGRVDSWKGSRGTLEVKRMKGR